MESFTPEQHERYEQYRRSAINKNTVRKVGRLQAGTIIINDAIHRCAVHPYDIWDEPKHECCSGYRWFL